MSKFTGTLIYVCLIMAISSISAQPSPVLDTAGNPLERGVEYYILPAGNNSGGGGLTLVRRNTPCPLYVGQENLPGSDGFPVIFTPFSSNETIVRESRDFRIVFSASTTCIQSTAWKVGETVGERRLIVTGVEEGYDGIFRINRNGNSYNLAWCPTDACPICRFNCGNAGIFVENGTRVLALDGPELAVVFRRV